MRGVDGARAAAYAARAATRAAGVPPESRGLLGVLEAAFYVMPPRIKLGVAEAVRDWAERKRLDALSQLGLADQPPAPAPPAGPEPIDTDGVSGW